MGGPSTRLSMQRIMLSQNTLFTFCRYPLSTRLLATHWIMRPWAAHRNRSLEMWLVRFNRGLIAPTASELMGQIGAWPKSSQHEIAGERQRIEHATGAASPRHTPGHSVWFARRETCRYLMEIVDGKIICERNCVCGRHTGNAVCSWRCRRNPTHESFSVQSV